MSAFEISQFFARKRANVLQILFDAGCSAHAKLGRRVWRALSNTHGVGEALGLFAACTSCAMRLAVHHRDRAHCGPPPHAWIATAQGAALCRPPGEQELMLHLQYIEEAQNSREALEDTLWIVLNKSEFLFQH